MKNKDIKDIIVIFAAKGLALDVQETSGKAYLNEKLLADFKQNPYKTLFYFGFEDRHPAMSASLSFVHDVCQKFINAVSRDPDIEITRTVKNRI